MKLAAFPLLFLAACAGSGGQPTPASSEGHPPPVAFLGVNVLDLASGDVLPNRTVTVREGRIESVRETSGDFEFDGQRIAGDGRFLMPGLAEMHGHIPPPSATPEYVENVLFLYLANGVTTVRGMLGAPGQLELRERANRGEILSPVLYLAGPSFNGTSIDSPQQAVEKVRQQKDEGWDLLKVHPGLTRDEYDAMADTAAEVGIRFAGHVPAEVGLEHAFEKEQETIDHLDGYIEFLIGEDENQIEISDEQLAGVAQMTREAGVAVVPTMALWETILGAADLEKMQSYPELRYMPEDQVRQWTEAYRRRLANPEVIPETARRVAEARKRLLKALSDGGVQILLGTDAPQLFSVPGFSIHRELPLMLESGMTPLQILRSGTVEVGEYFKKKDRFGAVAEGHRADLILLEANPLDDLANLQERAGVMIQGRWLPESEIQAKLAEISESP